MSGSVYNFVEFLKTLGPARIITLGAVMAGMLGFFAYVGMRVSQPPMALLFSDLSHQDASRVISELDSLNIPYNLQAEGSRILVPETRVLRLRLNMAEKGLPAGSTVGYEIFDNSDALGTTSFVQNLNHLRALEGELSRTIRAIDKVDAARVHLVLPEREVFSRTTTEPSASIVLRVRGVLNASQVNAIQTLVASAVEDLSASRVSIVDEKGFLLASGNGGDSAASVAASFEDRNVAFETRLGHEIEKIVESVVGSGNSRVRVNAVLDFNRVTRTSDRYDPEGQVIRSTQTVEENSLNEDGRTDEGVSVGNNVPDAVFGEENSETGNRESSNRVEETVNYEISRITETETLEGGRIKHISVAVLVDGEYEAPAEEGAEPTYIPRSEKDLEKISTLVRTAIGFSDKRGDQVEVINLQFAFPEKTEPLEEIEESFLSLTKTDYMRIAEMGVLAVVSLLVILFVARPMMRHLFSAQEAVAPASEQLALTDNTAGQTNNTPQLASPEGSQNNALPAPSGEASPVRSQIDAMINIAQVDGKVRESSIKKVGELVSSYPDETMGIIRNWMQEPV